jgi:hypothetical protein
LAAYSDPQPELHLKRANWLLRNRAMVHLRTSHAPQGCMSLASQLAAATRAARRFWGINLALRHLTPSDLKNLANILRLK